MTIRSVCGNNDVFPYVPFSCPTHQRIRRCLPNYSPKLISNIFLASKPSHGSTEIDFTSQLYNFDAPRVLNNNASAWDWWYFDAAAQDSDFGLTVVFYNSFEISSRTNLTSIFLTVTLPNGTMLEEVALNSSGAIITQERCIEGASGVWNGVGFSFKSEDSMGKYTIIIDAPDQGVQGTVVLEAVRSPHIYRSLFC